MFEPFHLRSGGTVEAERFVVRDKQSRTRVEMVMVMSYDLPNGNSVIRLLDDKGTNQTTLGAGVLRMVDGKGVEVALLDNAL